MNKDLKKSYDRLDLSYQATIEDVETSFPFEAL